MYLSIGIYIILFSVSFLYYEAKNKIKETTKSDNNKLKITNIIFLVILANAVFYSIIKMGQNNSKLFMQYDFQNFLSIEMVTYYITAIVFISRIARLLGNIIFGKVYKKNKRQNEYCIINMFGSSIHSIVIRSFYRYIFCNKSNINVTRIFLNFSN